jgi:hypothetical protein
MEQNQLVCVRNRENLYYYIAGTNIKHRLDGPAVIYKNGNTEWFNNGMPHRVDGPAIEQSGSKFWLINGRYHREDGPAIIYSDESVEWYLNGISFDKREEWFEALTEEKKVKALYSDYFIRG